MHSISAGRDQADNCNSRVFDATICFLDGLFTRRTYSCMPMAAKPHLREPFSRVFDPPATQQSWPRCDSDNFGRRLIGRPTASGALAVLHVGSSAHPIRQLEQIVLAYAVGQRVRQLPQLDGIVAQLLAEERLNSRHDFFL
jgi:hypothetical protein